MNETNNNEPDIREVLRSVAGSMVGAVTVACIIAGHRTGLYRAMDGRGALSADEVARNSRSGPSRSSSPTSTSSLTSGSDDRAPRPGRPIVG